MAKRKSRLTMPKDAPKPKKQRRVGGEPTAPSDEEWGKMTLYGKFIVDDEDDQPHQFKVGNYAVILPHGRSNGEQIEEHEYWVGKIKDIRCRNNDRTEVWTRVQWLYSGQDIAEERSTFDLTSCARMERFISNARDYVHTACYQGVVKCISYDETDVEQTMISESDFFYRYSYDSAKKQILPTPHGTCLCHKAYNPDTTALMHFCPRYTCQKAFHPACLVKSGSTEHEVMKDCASRYIQFERTFPNASIRDTRDPTIPNVGAEKREHSREGSYDHVPEELLALARSPMAKGKKLPAGGVVGNIPIVMRARELVFKILESGSDLSIRWKEAIGLEDLAVGDLVAKDSGLVCPGCGGAI